MATKYNTVNGQQTEDSMRQQLMAAGWDGSGSVADAYARTTGGDVSAMSDTGVGGGGGAPSGGGGGGGSNQQLLSGLDQQLSALMAAMSATNEQDFQEKIREFNIGQQNWQQQFNAQMGGTLPNGQQTFPAQMQQAGLMGMFNGQPTLTAQQMAQQNALGVANETGSYQAPAMPTQQYVAKANGEMGQMMSDGTIRPFGSWQDFVNAGGSQQTAQQALTSPMADAQFNSGVQGFQNAKSGVGGTPTLAAQQLSGVLTNGQPTEQARQFNVNTGVDLAKLASSLSGPADYFKYLTALNGGQSILSNLYTGKAMPAGGAPVGATQPQSVQNILGGLGLGQPGGQGTASSGVNTTQNGRVQLPYGMGSVPQMNQIQPTAWNSMSPSGQKFFQGAYAAAGYDPSDIQRNIESETPATGAAPRGGSTSFGASAGSSLFG